MFLPQSGQPRTGCRRVQRGGRRFVVQTAGTNIGDLSAHTVGLAVSTALSVAAFIGVLLLWPKPHGVVLGGT
jgi:hypothetical protein